MKKFNPSEYEQVDERIKSFYKENTEGSIITKLVSQTNEMVVMKAYIYKNKENQEKNLPTATGYAKEVRDVELKKTADGRTYESVNFTSWIENAETSAIGRALANMGMSGAKRASREEMESVNRVMQRATSTLETSKPSGKTKECTKCGGVSYYKEGHTKSGKPYRGYFCSNQECKHAEWLETETLTF